MITLVQEPGDKPGTFTTSVPNEGVLVRNSKKTIRPAARELLKRGYPLRTLLTIKAHDRDYPSFKPRPIVDWAMEMLSERDARGFVLDKWRPHPSQEVPEWYRDVVLEETQDGPESVPKEGLAA